MKGKLNRLGDFTSIKFTAATDVTLILDLFNSGGGSRVLAVWMAVAGQRPHRL